MQAGRLTIIERLENRSEHGRVYAELNLYPRQVRKLINEGFTLEKISPVYGRYGQYRYHVSWRNAVPNTVAYSLLMNAVDNNEQLREELAQSNSDPVKPPYTF